MFEDVIPVWKQFIQLDGAMQRRVSDHPLSLWFGSDASSKPIFFLITDVEPAFPRLADVVSVDKGRREDGRWTVVLTLQRPELADSFMGLCVELIRRAAVTSVEPTARSIFFATLDDWKNLLAGSKARELSREQVRGLCAELWFASHALAFRITAPAALIAWQGPYGAPQDFQVADGDMFEIKAIHSGSRSVKISSAEQLDPVSDGGLTLALVVVDEVPPGTPEAVSLTSLIREFRLAIEAGAGHIDEFEHRLDAIGLDYGDPAYGRDFYLIGNPRYFEVRDDFPRIARDSVPLGVAKVKYELEISSLSTFASSGVNA
jgi:hypothetical protein